MDPATALSVMSLAFQVFSGCIKGCQLLLDAKDLPRKYSYLRHRLFLEQLMLLDWWEASGLIAETAFRDTESDDRKRAIVESLVQIRSITFDTDQIKKRYDLLLENSIGVQSDDTSMSGGFLMLDSKGTLGAREKLRQKSLRYADVAMKCSKGLRWAVFDAARFEQLLARFSELNKFLRFSLESEQRKQYIKLHETSQIQILQLHDKLDQLIRSLRLAPHCDSGGSRQDSDEDVPSTLERLARFKAFSTMVDYEKAPFQEDVMLQIGLQIPPPGVLELRMSQIKFCDIDGQHGAQRIAGIFGGTAIWVEWKRYGESNTTLSYRCIENRITRLVALLKNADTPRELRLPTSLGYIHDPASARFGMVFKLPPLTNATSPPSLYGRLRTTMKPSLNVRLNMARKLTIGLEYIHATEWLHKGLRSDNILFLAPNDLDWLSFCLSGFDYSRPANPDEMTELPSDNREHDLYRHPDVQFDVPRDGKYGYKKKHDIYSLGVILMEIGLWQPIHQFLGISLNRCIPRPIIRKARGSLLKPGSLNILESETGERYADAVKLCLIGIPSGSEDKLKSLALSRDDRLRETSEEISMRCLSQVKEILQSIEL